MENKITHIEIPVKDVKKAKSFFESIFSWEVTIDTGFDGYAFFKTGETGVGGALNKTDKVATGAIMLFIEVEDIPKTLKEIEKQGGKTTQEKTAIGGDMGFYAAFQDIFGNTLGLWSEK